MKIEWLRIFIEIASMGSMTKAASNLYVSEQNISRIVKTMEQELNSKLLEKTPQGCKLTESGSLFYSFATETVKQYQTVKANIDSLENNEKEREFVQRITIVASHGLSDLFVRFNYPSNNQDIKVIPSIISYGSSYIYEHFNEIAANIIIFTIPEKDLEPFVMNIKESYSLEYYCFDSPHLIGSKSFFSINNLNEESISLKQVETLPCISFFTEYSLGVMPGTNNYIYQDYATTNSIDYLWKNVYNGNNCIMALPLVAKSYNKKRSKNLVMSSINDQERWVHLVLKERINNKVVDLFLDEWHKQNPEFIHN